ncbi:MAG: alkyl hydroperoxide reductase subunit F [Muribaculaceae bacterium]|nr:alkyl hydroperoxide reductase subunit F [Muribaculaceae bacterium]
MINSSLSQQLKDIFKDLSQGILLLVLGDPNNPKRKEMEEFANDFAATSDAISVKVEDSPTEEGAPVLAIWRDGVPTGIEFVGIPGGHEFSSLILAVLNSSGIGKNLPDAVTQKRIEALNGPVEILTFVSLTCTICPDVVQSLNLITLLNPSITNKIIDGAIAPQMIKDYNVNGVPVVYANGTMLNVGQASLGELINKLEERFGKSDLVSKVDHTPVGFDVMIAGGGPAGASAAVYLARKGLKVGVIAGRVGGQVNDTTDIENLISVPLTTGSALAGELRNLMNTNGISIYDNRRIVESVLSGFPKRLKVDTGETFEAPLLIIATGASWRKLNIPGEEEYIGKGVAFCTHCDGPFFAGKKVAVVGGGNSGIEAAIDLAAICEHVDVFEYMDTLKADEVLLNKMKTMHNISVHCGSAVNEIKGNGKNVTAIAVTDRKTGDATDYDVAGVFVQIGLTSNSEIFADQLQINKKREIEVTRDCRTSIPGVYAAGDVTDTTYKLIVIAMGEGAKAALSAADDRMRGVTPS